MFLAAQLWIEAGERSKCIFRNALEIANIISITDIASFTP